MRPDDKIEVRGRVQGATRDNVVFELGLFMGKLDRNRTFALVADGVDLPSDFHGVTYIALPGPGKPESESYLDAPVDKILQNEIRGNERAGVALLDGTQLSTFNGNRIVDGRAEGVYCEIDMTYGDNVVERNQPDWRSSDGTATPGHPAG